MNESAVPFKPARFRFRPRMVVALKDYSREKFFNDLGAGLTVGVVALSLCIGLGISSGATPQAGLYTGIIGGFLVSALGGSRVQVGGPAGAFAGLLAMLVAHYGMADVLLCTMMAGLILFAMGALRLGDLIKFVPHPVTTGFTCGIAVTIFALQVRALLGLQLNPEPAEFLPKVGALVRGLPGLHWPTVALSLFSLVLIMYWPKRWSRVPGSIVAVLLGTVVVVVCNHVQPGVGFETIGSKYGGIPRGLPTFHFPALNLDHLGGLVRPAFTIALLCAIESLLSAVVADGMIDDRHDSNQELMAMGVANFSTSLFGGLPATGVIARTATNIRCGAGSPVAGIVHAVFLLVVLLVAAPLAKDIPLCVLAAVLAVVALRMGEWEEFGLLNKKPKGDTAVFIATFGLTVLFDLTVAVEVGLVLAAFSFIKRVADTTQVHAMAGEGELGTQGHERVSGLPPGVMVYRVFGALLFGSAEKLDRIIRRSGGETKVVILHVAAVTAMDATALNRIENMHAKMKKHREHLILSGPHTQPYFMMEKAGFFDVLGRENVCADLESAVARARELVTAK